MTDHHEYAAVTQGWRHIRQSDVVDLLDSPVGEDVRLNVKRGGGWLAERDPQWAEKIVAAVEQGDFNLSACKRCAVGTVLGDYDEHFANAAVYGVDEPVDLGFVVSPQSLGISDQLYDLAWAAVEQAWVDYAYEQVGTMRRWNPNGIVARYGNKKRVRKILASEEGDIIRRRVRRGARWLEEREPQWADMIVDAVDDRRFDLTMSCNCAVGTVLGSWDQHHHEYRATPVGKGERRDGEHLSASDGDHLGFSVPSYDYEDPYDENDRRLWAAVEQAWVDLARERTQR